MIQGMAATNWTSTSTRPSDKKIQEWSRLIIWPEATAEIESNSNQTSRRLDLGYYVETATEVRLRNPLMEMM